jgi:hypothetical protein
LIRDIPVADVFCCDGCVTQGTTKCETWKDKWTVVTKDGGLAAQYEHTILITPQGAEILTLADGVQPAWLTNKSSSSASSSGGGFGGKASKPAASKPVSKSGKGF